MPVTVTISVTFKADSRDAAQAVIDGLGLPPGAMVSAGLTEALAAGVVAEDGNIAAPKPPTPLVPPGNGEPSPE